MRCRKYEDLTTRGRVEIARKIETARELASSPWGPPWSRALESAEEDPRTVRTLRSTLTKEAIAVSEFTVLTARLVRASATL